MEPAPRTASRPRRRLLLGAGAFLAAVVVAPVLPLQAAQGQLQGEWHLDDSNAGITPDSSANGLGLGLTNAVIGGGGRFGGADLELAGNGVARRAAATSLESPATTVVAWVRYTGGNAGPGNLKYVAADGTHGCNGSSWALYTGSGGGMQFYTYDSGGNVHASPPAPVVPGGLWNGQWHSVAGSFDGSTVRLYVDGSEVGSGTATSAAIDYAGADSHDFTLGNYPNTGCGSYGFNGGIDEVHVYNRALTPSELQALMQPTGTTAPEIPEPGEPPPTTTTTTTTPPTGDEHAVISAQTAKTFHVKDSTLGGDLMGWFGADASTASPGHEIVRYLWDFDSDGQADITCGTDAPAAFHQYSKPGIHHVTLTTEDDSGVDATTEQEIKVFALRHHHGKAANPAKKPHLGLANLIREVSFCTTQLNTQQPSTADCIRSVQFGVMDVNARSENCFEVLDGVRNGAMGRATYLRRGLGTPSHDKYNNIIATVKGPVAFDGLVVPLPNNVTSTYKNSGVIKLGTHDIGFDLGDRHVTLANIDLSVDDLYGDEDYHLGGVKVGGLGDLGGLGFEAKADLDLVAPGQTRLTLHVRLPSELTAAPFGKPADFEVAIYADNTHPFVLDNVHAFVPWAFLGPVVIQDLQLDYTGDQWSGGANFILVPLDVTLDARPRANTDYGITFDHGSLAHAGAVLNLGEAAEPMIGPGVFLHALAATFGTSPTRGCGAGTLRAGKIYSVTGTLAAVFPSGGETYEIPTAGECGFPSVPAGTTVDRPTVVGGGQVAVDVCCGLQLPLADAFALYETPDLLLFGGQVHVPLGVFSVDGSAQGFIDGSTNRFNIEGRGDYTLTGIGALHGSLLASNRGIGGCAGATVDDPFDPPDFETSISMGFTYGWGNYTPELYLLSCDVGKYRVTLSARRSSRLAARALPTDTAFDVAKGLPSVSLELTGTGGAPDVTLHGPNGETYSTAGQPSGTTLPFIFLRDDPHSIGYLAVQKPAAGHWTLTANDGSAPLATVSVAEGLDKPSIKATVRGDGAKRTIDYEIEQQSGLSVEFAEQGDGVYRDLGPAKGAKGHLTFKPVDEVGGKRKIVATVSHNGIATETLDVAAFKAPAPPKMTPPEGLKVQRKGEKVLVRFKQVAGAATYSVTLKTNDGFSQLAIAKKGKATFASVSPALTGKVLVSALTIDGDAGKPATAKLKAAR
jgi:PKD repeat protein